MQGYWSEISITPKIQGHRKMMSAGLKHIAVHRRGMAFTV